MSALRGPAEALSCLLKVNQRCECQVLAQQPNFLIPLNLSHTHVSVQYKGISRRTRCPGNLYHGASAPGTLLVCNLTVFLWCSASFESCCTRCGHALFSPDTVFCVINKRGVRS